MKLLNEVVLKALFKIKDTDLDFAHAVQAPIEIKDAVKVAKETVYESKIRPVNKVKWSQKKDERKKQAT